MQENKQRKSRLLDDDAIAKSAQLVDTPWPISQRVNFTPNRRREVGSMFKHCAPLGSVTVQRNGKEASGVVGIGDVPPGSEAWREQGKAAACVGSGVPPAPNAMFGPPFSPSVERGVPHC